MRSRLNLWETAQQASSTAGYPCFVSGICTQAACTLGRVINDVCQYFFDGDSDFAIFYTYKKEYMIFFLKFYGSALWIFISKKLA